MLAACLDGLERPPLLPQLSCAFLSLLCLSPCPLLTLLLGYRGAMYFMGGLGLTLAGIFEWVLGK